MTSIRPGRRLWQHAVAIILYTALALWLTWPLASRLGSALAGNSTDALLHYWNAWWVREAIRSGQSLTYTRHIFYPEGASLLTHNIAWLGIAPWLVLQAAIDDLLAYNLVFLANLILGGYATFLLASRLTANRLAAWLAGLIVMAWPYTLSQLDHPNLASTYWIPLLFLFLIAAFQEGRWGYGLAAGFCLAMVGYTRWQLLIPAGILLATYLLVTIRDWLGDRQQRLILLLSLGTAALLLAFPAWRLIREQLNNAATSESLLLESEEALMQTDLLAYLTPAAGQPLFGKLTGPAYARYYADRTALRRFPSYLGLATLALAAVGLWRRPQSSLPWLIMAAAILLLALGPVLRINGRLLPGVPMPYRLLEPLFVLRLMREPERFNIALALPLAILAAFGLAAGLDWLRDKNMGTAPWQAGIAAAIGLLILFDFAAGPIRLQEATTLPYFDQLADEEGEFAILTLPIDALKAKIQMFDQTAHGRPLLHGHISREPPGAYAFIDGDPWLRVLRQTDEMPLWLTDVSEQLEKLAEEEIRYIIFYKDQVGGDRIDHWRRYLGFNAVYEDEEIAVYRSQPTAGGDFELLAELAPGLGPVKTLLTANCSRPGQPFEVDVLWGTAAESPTPAAVRLSLLDASGQMVQTADFALDPEEDEKPKPANSLFWGLYPLRLDDDLAPGDYSLSLSLADPAAGYDLGSLAIVDDWCPAGLPEEAKPVDALFGDGMRLLGYELARPSADRLLVTLTWRGEQRMAADYKVFVHVFDPETGVPVAQDDAMPHQGGLPTRFWASGERLFDPIPIDLSGAPPGTYGLAIGVYDPLTGDRLPLLEHDGAQPTDRRLVTGETVTVEGP